MNCSRRLWQPVLDLPGFAASPSGEPQPDVVQPHLRGRSLDDCVDRLLAQLPPRFSLAGLSLGAIVALALVRRAPEHVGTPRIAGGQRAGTAAGPAGRLGAQRRMLAEGGTARALQEQLLPVLVAPDRRGPGLDAVLLAMADEVGEAALDDQLAVQQTRLDERPALSRVAVPTLVVAGAEDALVPVERHEEVRAAVPGAHLEVLEGTGHLSTLEAPHAVAAALSAWLTW